MGLFGNKNGQKGKFRQIFELAKPMLNLSAEQEKQARDIFMEFRQDRQNLKKEGDSSGDGDIKSEMQEARQEAKHKIMALLTADQKKIFEDNIQKWRSQIE